MTNDPFKNWLKVDDMKKWLLVVFGTLAGLLAVGHPRAYRDAPLAITE